MILLLNTRTTELGRSVSSNITAAFAYAMRLEDIKNNRFIADIRQAVDTVVHSQIAEIHSNLRQLADTYPDEHVAKSATDVLTDQISLPVIKAAAKIWADYPECYQICVSECVGFGLRQIDDNPLVVELDRLVGEYA